MKRWIFGVLLGVVIGWAGQAAAQQAAVGQVLTERHLEAARGTRFDVPPRYGRLVDVTVSSEVHHLYFSDDQGTVRIVLIGPKGAVQKARHGLQLLSKDVYVIERRESAVIRTPLSP